MKLIARTIAAVGMAALAIGAVGGIAFADAATAAGPSPGTTVPSHTSRTGPAGGSRQHHARVPMAAADTGGGSTAASSTPWLESIGFGVLAAGAAGFALVSIRRLRREP